jgi:hypothetical protein
MARVLADGKTKFSVLTTKPVDVANPTAGELNAGYDLSDDILQSDFNWTATDSDKVAERALSQKNNSNALGASNYTTGLTLWRKYLAGGGADVANEAGWAALLAKGSTVWCYARESDKDADDVWANGDPIYMGGEVNTDTPQRTDGSGFIKRRIPMEPQEMYDNILAGTGEVNALGTVILSTTTVAAVSIVNGGTGYAVAPTVVFAGGGGTGAAATAFVSGGKIVAVDVTAAGTGYTTVPTVSFTRV